jgi:hypothetical protein
MLRDEDDEVDVKPKVEARLEKIEAENVKKDKRRVGLIEW